MDYLNSINEPLKSINEQNIEYINILKHPELVYGTVKKSAKVDFCKYSKEVQDEIIHFGQTAYNSMEFNKNSTCGCRIRFKTNSRRLVFKIELERPFVNKNMVGWNAFGIDIYLVDEKGNYSQNRLMAPQEGIKIYADHMYLPPNSSVCIFLPNYNSIKNMKIGFEYGSKIKTFKYPKNKQTPILFYGNSITQGSAATKSGNSFPNIVSRTLNQDIINLSGDSCCRGTINAAKMIGNIDCDSIIIDYSKDVPNADILERTHETFYKKVREYHPDKKIIIMTTALFNRWKEYEPYDKIITKTYENAVKRGENTFLLNQKEVFDEEEYDYITITNNHYTDYGMFKIAEKICEILK